MPCVCHCPVTVAVWPTATSFRLSLPFCEARVLLLTKHMCVFLSLSPDILTFFSIPILWTPHTFPVKGSHEKYKSYIQNFAFSLRLVRYLSLHGFVWTFSLSSQRHKQQIYLPWELRLVYCCTQNDKLSICLSLFSNSCHILLKITVKKCLLSIHLQ